MGKRIRYPKKKLEKIEQKNENKEVQTNEKQETHFVLQVHNSVIGGTSKIGN